MNSFSETVSSSSSSTELSTRELSLFDEDFFLRNV